MSLLILNNRLVYVGKAKYLMSELKKLPPRATVKSIINQRLH
ncbi:MAG: hypothetical protein ACOX4Q_04045 [Syntrophomonadales bacterium]